MDHDKTKNENILLLADILVPAEACSRIIFFSFKNANWYSF